MAFTAAYLDQLEDAISSGATSVSFEGKSTTFRSLDDMLRIRAIIRRSLGLDPAQSATVLTGHNRGFPGYGGACGGGYWGYFSDEL